MAFRQLVMLSSYRMPSHYPLMLGEADTSAWLWAFRSLWHPVLLSDADELPVIADAKDHATPQPATLYAVPCTPAPYLPENWTELLRSAGAAAYFTGPTWNETEIRRERAVAEFQRGTFASDTDECIFAGLGFGRAVIETLYDAMEHARLLDTAEFTREIQMAARGSDRLQHLRRAAERLHSARESLYPVTIHLVDISEIGSRESGSVRNVVATADELTRMSDRDLCELRKRIEGGKVEICGGVDCDRPEAELPLESQLWNLRNGQARLRELIGRSANVFARRRTSFHPHLPAWLVHSSMNKAMYLAFDGGTIPKHSAAVIRWPSPDGRQVDALARAPHSANDAQVYFHLAHHLHQTIMNDQSAVVVLHHGQPPAGIWYDDWQALSDLAPVLGSWTTVSEYLDAAPIGEYASVTSADDYAPDALETAVNGNEADPVSRFARHLRSRRRLDAARTYQALLRSLGSEPAADLLASLDRVEAIIECNLGSASEELTQLESDAARQLADRLVSRTKDGQPGWLVINPCAFPRRVGIEMGSHHGTPAVGGAIRAVQRESNLLRCVVEVPELGYAWLPANDNAAGHSQLQLAEGTTVHNEFFEAEVDPATGGLRAFRDRKTQTNRVAQQLIWQPGGTMKAHEVRVSVCGPALGEVTAIGEIVDDHGKPLATFEQKVRAWAGRPLLELHIELKPLQLPTGHPWHAYFGARFAGRDDEAALHRGLFGRSTVTTHHRPGSPDFLEFRAGSSNVLVVTGGLPYAQRHGDRMFDIILIPAGETATSFELYLGLDRKQPAHSAQGIVTPAAVVKVDRGPPPSGSVGWLAHLDSPNLLLTSMQPDLKARAIVARLFETAGIGGPTTFRWACDPRSASLVDGDGLTTLDADVSGDAVSFDVTANELVNLRVEF